MLPRTRSWMLPIFVVILSFLTFYTPTAHAGQISAPTTPFSIYGSAATIDSEGALIVIGSSGSFSNGQSQAFWFKYSPTGHPLCMNTFGDAEPLQTFGYGVTTDSSDNIYVTGATQTFGGEDYDVFLQEFTSSCNLLHNTVQWGGEGNDIPRGIAADALGNVYIAGSTDSFSNGRTDIFLLKYTGIDNEFQFSVTWGSGTGNSYGNGVAVDNLGDVYVVGTTTTNSYQAAATDIVLLKYDSSGNLLFKRTWGGQLNNYGTGVAVDNAGNVYVTGYTYSLGPTPGISSVVLLKYDPYGNLLSQKIWGGIENDYAQAVTVDFDGNVYLTGFTKSYSIAPEIPSAFLLKYDPAGNLLFQKIWGGHRGDFGYGIAVDLRENVWVTGYTYSFGANSQGTNFFILKYDISGNLVSQRIYSGGTPDP